MIIRSKAPLRIGLAGGGTDVSPYSDMYGGAILNATIDLYAYASLEPLNNGKIEFVIDGSSKTLSLDSQKELSIFPEFELFIGVYNRIVKQFNLNPLSFRLTSFVEAPQGSGLGTSSTIVVSLLGAFIEWLNLPLGKSLKQRPNSAWEIVDVIKSEEDSLEFTLSFEVFPEILLGEMPARNKLSEA